MELKTIDAAPAQDGPGQCDLTPPRDRVADGYRAMDERRAIKALLQP